MARVRRRPAGGDRARPAARRDPADGVLPGRRGRVHPLGGDGRRPLRRRSARRSSRSSSATGRRRRSRPRPRRSARPTSIYLSGGKPGYLLEVLDGSAVGRALADAHERGAVLAGCSAGAMVLAGYTFDLRLRLAPWPLRWRHGLGFAAGRVGRAPLRRLARADVRADRAPGAAGVGGPRHRRGDRRSSGSDGAWQVHGRSRVTVWRGRRRERFRAGDTFRL